MIESFVVVSVSGMVERYDLASPWGLEYKTVLAELNQPSLPSDVNHKSAAGPTCSINDGQGITVFISCLSCYYYCLGFSIACTASPLL